MVALSTTVRGSTRLILNAVYRVNGNLVADEQILLDICLPNSREVAYPLNLIAWWGLAELYEAQGQLRAWGSRYEQLFQVLGPHPNLPPLPLAVIQMSKATLLYEWNRLREAAATAQEAISLTEQIDLNPLSRFSRWIQARIELAQGHIEAARAFLESEPPLTPQSPYPSLAARPARLALACG
jgi:tetratricopeptide (TPR) repeat protein